MTDTPESIGRLTFAAREAWAPRGCIVFVHPPLCPKHGEPWDAVVTGPLGDLVVTVHGATEREALEAVIVAAGEPS